MRGGSGTEPQTYHADEVDSDGVGRGSNIMVADSSALLMPALWMTTLGQRRTQGCLYAGLMA